MNQSINDSCLDSPADSKRFKRDVRKSTVTNACNLAAVKTAVSEK